MCPMCKRYPLVVDVTGTAHCPACGFDATHSWFEPALITGQKGEKNEDIQV